MIEKKFITSSLEENSLPRMVVKDWGKEELKSEKRTIIAVIRFIEKRFFESALFKKKSSFNFIDSSEFIQIKKEPDKSEEMTIGSSPKLV